MDVAGDFPEDVKAQLQELASVIGLERERQSQESAEARRVLKPLFGVDRGNGRAAEADRLKQDGSLVGRSHKDFGVTIYQRNFVTQLDREKVRKSLMGQGLMGGQMILRKQGS